VALLLRAAELLVCLMLVVWTMIFPVATLLSLGLILPLFALLSRPVAAHDRRQSRLRQRASS
jgi:hypothetical protein